MSSPPPSLPTAAPAATAAPAERFILNVVRPLAMASLLVAMVAVLWFLLQAVLAVPLAGTGLWQWLQAMAADQQWPASLSWMLHHPVATSLCLAAACVPSVLASWGLYRQRRWGLWLFTVLLVVSGLANLLIAWWIDGLAGVLLSHVGDPELLTELQAERILLALTMYGGSLAMLVLQVWFAWRLLHPDVRARF